MTLPYGQLQIAMDSQPIDEYAPIPKAIRPLELRVELIEGLGWFECIERQLIVDALDRCGGVQRRAAIELEIPKSTLFDRIRHYKIEVRQ